jgi:hypothetical protein
MMALLTTFLSLNCPGDKSLVRVKEQLATAKLRAVQTFDLHSARHGLEDCPCPHHGTEQCDCQMVVLLVYANAAEPATLILHGNDGRTWISLVEHPGHQPSQAAVRAIQQALEIQGSVGI